MESESIRLLAVKSGCNRLNEDIYRQRNPVHKIMIRMVKRIFHRFVAALAFSCAALIAQDHTPQNERNPFAGSSEAAMSGEKLYKAACQTCHGGNGAGDRGPALATGKFPHGGADGQLFINIRNGIPGSQMPPFSKLTNEQTWQLVTYIRSLSGSIM